MKDDSNQIRLFTTLQPAECVSVLSEAIDAERFGFLTWPGAKPVLGKVTASSLRLRKRTLYGGRNAFQTLLTATMKLTEGGTIINGKLAIDVRTWIFMSVWFGLFIIGGGIMFVTSIGSLLFGSTPAEKDAWVGIVLPAAGLVFAFTIVSVGRYFARDEGLFLKDFLVKTLDARSTDRAN